MNIIMNNDDLLEWSIFANKLKTAAKEAKIPVSGTFELTPRCNLKCKMCYVRLTPQQMEQIGRERTAAEWIEMGRQAAESGTLFLLLTGGEPFIRPDFRQIYEALSQMGFLISIFSNGTLINERTVDWLVKLPPAEIKISIYGASNETYRNVCGISDGFDKTLQAIKLLKDAGINVCCGSTIIQENLQDVASIERQIKDLNLYISHNPNVIGEVRGASWDAKTSRLSIEQFSDFIGRDRVSFRKAGDSDGTFNNICSQANCGYWITWDGKMVVCSFMDTPCTFPFNTGFDPAWHDLTSLISTIKEPEKCFDCIDRLFCMNCPGMLNSESGSYNDVSERICHLAKTFSQQFSSIATNHTS